MDSKVIRASIPLDLSGLRWAGAAMITLGVGLPLLPHDPGLPCPLRTMTGVPCPACGMTTAVKACVAGHLGASVAANPFGIVAVIAAVLLIVRPGWRHAHIPVAVVVACALVSWTWELRRFGFI